MRRFLSMLPMLAVIAAASSCTHPNTHTPSDALKEDWQQTYTLVGSGKSAEAAIWAQKAVDLSQTESGEDSTDYIRSLYDLANIESGLNRAEGEQLLKRTLAIREKVLGPENKDVAQNLNNLALFIENEGRYAEAESLIKRAGDLREGARPQ
jgi:hypothetical protein